MKIKILCDRCKREFEIEDYDYEANRETICPNCKGDITN